MKQSSFKPINQVLDSGLIVAKSDNAASASRLAAVISC
jgi:hypothetical protein